MEAKVREDKEFLFGHPKGLYILFLTETWERFSYYGMRALLILYLTQSFLMTDVSAFAIYGSYTALVYISPVIGGILADRYLGFTKSVVFGGILMLIGHLTLGFSDIFHANNLAGDNGGNISVAPAASQVFYLSLSFLIIGVGFLKPNISTMVGDLYPKNSHLRDSGFTIFVWGINLGAAVSAFICGYVGQKYGWGYGFSLAGIGMGVGLANFLLGQKHLRGIGNPPQPDWLKQPTWIGLNREYAIYLAAILSTVLVWQFVQITEVLGYFVAGSVILSIAGALFFAFMYLEKIEREQVIAALGLTSAWVCFAALIEQMGSSISLFTERVVDRVIDFDNVTSSAQVGSALIAESAASGFFEIQAAQFQGLLATFIILLAPVFAWLWVYLERRNLNPSTPVKMSLSLIIVGIGYGILTLGITWSGEDSQVHLIWLVFLYFLFAVADMFIAPVGLSVITKLSPAKIVGFMMGLWMMAVAIGSYLAALIARFSSLDPTLLESSNPAAILANYQSFFSYLAVGAIVLGACYLFMSLFIKKWMHGVK